MADGDILAGLALFRKGRYFDAHEAWESLWHNAQGDRKTYLQGLVQTAVALHHLKNDNRAGAAYLYKKVLSKWEQHLKKEEAGVEAFNALKTAMEERA
jgi:hypothetical protein